MTVLQNVNIIYQLFLLTIRLSTALPNDSYFTPQILRNTELTLKCYARFSQTEKQSNDIFFQKLVGEQIK